MKPSDYIERRNKLIADFTEGLQVRNDEYLNGQLQMVSAGLMNYLPAIGIEKHETIFQQILLHKKLSILEQQHYEVLDYVKTEGPAPDMLALLKSKAAVICTFHTGSYRVLNLFLSRNKIPYTLVISKEVAEKEGSLFTSLFQQLPGTTANETFKIIHAEAANSGLQMLRDLRAGRSLVLYIDGNTGAGAATTKNDNRCVVHFLQQQLYARKGIAYLAHLAKVPVLTVACYRKTWEDIRLRFFDPVFPKLEKDRELFATATTQHVYDLVAPLIKKYPEQWEGWLYIHKVAKIVSSTLYPVEKRLCKNSSGKMYFDSFRFGIFKVHGNPFLLKKSSYSFYAIDEQLYDFLMNCIAAPAARTGLNEALLVRLQQEGVLTYD